MGILNSLVVVFGPATLSVENNPDGALGLVTLLWLASWGTVIIASILFLFGLFCKIFKINI